MEKVEAKSARESLAAATCPSVLPRFPVHPQIAADLLQRTKSAALGQKRKLGRLPSPSATELALRRVMSGPCLSQ
jgi:hypothetical protein